MFWCLLGGARRRTGARWVLACGVLVVSRVVWGLSSSSTILNPEQRRQQSLTHGNHPLLSLNMNLDALARAQAPERAQELYQRIAALYAEGYYATAPDVVSFNSVLKAWQQNPSKALEFWETALEHNDDDEEEEDALQNNSQSHPRKGRRTALVEPNVRSYNTFLLALARAGMYEHAETLLLQMEDSLVVPDRVTYNTVLLSYVCAIYNIDSSHVNDAAGRLEIAKRAHDLLNDLVYDGFRETIIEESVDDETSIANMPSARAMIMPDVVSFNTVISAYAAVRTNAAANACREILSCMNINEGVRPDVYSYTTVIHAMAQCRGNSQSALELLQEMIDRNNREMGSLLSPNKVTYTVVMRALCRDDKPDKAQSLLEKLMEQSATDDSLRPDVVAFSTVIDGWARVADRRPREAVLAMEDLYQQMKDLSSQAKDGHRRFDITPSPQTYASLLSGLARSRQGPAGPRAEALLQEMKQVSGNKPNLIHWNAVLDAYAKSPYPDKTLSIRRLWDEVASSHDIVPDIISYNTVLAAAANSFGKDEKVKRNCLTLAFEIFGKIQKDKGVRPTSLTYHYVFKVIRKFMPAGTKRFEFTSRIFQYCCNDGCINQHILHQLLQHLSEEEVRTLFGTALGPNEKLDLSVEERLPPEWRSQALQGRRKPGKSRWERTCAPEDSVFVR